VLVAVLRPQKDVPRIVRMAMLEAIFLINT
jgi:hypothetical protein